MGKILLLFGVALAAGLYLGVETLFGEKKDGFLPKPRSVVEKEKQEAAKKEAEKRPHKYNAGDCLTLNKGWEFTKITKVSDGLYEVIDCHKYKGCGKVTSLEWYQLEFEFKKGTKMKCPN